LSGVALEQRLGVYGTLYNRTRGLEVRHGRPTGPSEHLMIAQGRLTGDWCAYRFVFAPQAPHGIVSVTIDAIPASEAQRLMQG
jgi:hypothetical protein